jgi:hypothetical protein
MEISKEKETNTRPGAGQKIIITKDHDIKEILKYHRDGYSIHFDGSKENFVNLDDEDFIQLPKAVMVYYRIAEKEFNGKLSEVFDTIAEEGTPRRIFGYDKRVADPKEQLEIQDIPKGFRAKWVRAYDNEIDKNERKGYVVARGNDIKTFGNDGSRSGGHYVGSEDKPEMVAMLISDENYHKNQARVKRKSQLMKEATKDNFKESIEKSGLRGAQAEVEIK